MCSTSTSVVPCVSEALEEHPQLNKPNVMIRFNVGDDDGDGDDDDENHNCGDDDDGG